MSNKNSRRSAACRCPYRCRSLSWALGRSGGEDGPAQDRTRAGFLVPPALKRPCVGGSRWGSQRECSWGAGVQLAWARGVPLSSCLLSRHLGSRKPRQEARVPPAAPCGRGFKRPSCPCWTARRCRARGAVCSVAGLAGAVLGTGGLRGARAAAPRQRPSHLPPGPNCGPFGGFTTLLSPTAGPQFAEDPSQLPPSPFGDYRQYQ